jgi:hypothetical protein
MTKKEKRPAPESQSAPTQGSGPMPAKTMRQKLEEAGLRVSPPSGRGYVVGVPLPATEPTEAEAFLKHRQRQQGQPVLPKR